MMKHRTTVLAMLAFLALPACKKDTSPPAPTLPDATASCRVDGESYSVKTILLSLDTVSQPSLTNNTISLTGNDGSKINLYFQGEAEQQYSFSQSGANRATYLDTLGNTYKSINGSITLSKYDNDSSITWMNGTFQFDGELFSDQPLVKVTNGSFKNVSNK